jgi:hypothetical protein
MARRAAWSGTATKLLCELCEIVDENVRKGRNWPGDGRALSGRLRRAAPCLRKLGIEITRDRDKGRKRSRIIDITVTPENTALGASAPSASSVTTHESNAGRDTPGHSIRTKPAEADDGTDDRDAKLAPIVRERSLKPNGWTDADDADAKFAQFSYSQAADLSELQDLLRELRTDDEPAS